MSKIKINRTKIFIIIFVLLIVMLTIFAVLLEDVEKKVEEQNIVVSYENLKNIKEVVEYHKSTYISEKISEKENYDLDVRLKFKYDLYDGEKSNEIFFNNMIKDIARVAKYINFRLIDEEKEITIEVTCVDGNIDTIITNGIEDYFVYKDSQINFSKYKEIKTKDFIVESPIISELLNNNWDKNTNFGTRESIYDLYDIYFDEGIAVRNIDSKVFNVIFNKKYNSNVINGIYPGMSLSSIKTILGTPSFEDDTLKYIGYKGKNMYVFFTESEISVYKIDKKDMSGFLSLMDKFLDDEIDFLDLMNEMTYLWPDYSEYEYTENSIFLSYPLAGIDIKINYDNTTGIIIYNNVNELDKVKNYLEHTDFIALLQVDNVNLNESRRLQKKNDEKEKMEKYLKESNKEYTGYKSNLYNWYPEIDNLGYKVKMKFISKDENNPNREINDYIDTYIWINDIYFLYSKSKKGIYFYDLTTGNTQNLIEGNEEYKIKEFKDGILKFDNTEVSIEF